MDDAEVRRVNLLEVLAEEFPHVPPLPATLAGAWTEEKLRAFHTTAPAAHVARQQAQLQCDVRVAGPQGQLQCDVATGGGAGAGARLGVVLLHPHPHMGGSKGNNVVEALWTRLRRHGDSLTVCRYNSSGVGTSEGACLADVESEAKDLAAVCRYLRQARGCAALVLVGYSFGALVAHAAAASTDGVVGYVLVGFPYLMAPSRFPVCPALPKLLVMGDADDVSLGAPGLAAFQRYAEALPSARVHVVHGVNHFWAGTEPHVVREVERWLFSTILPCNPSCNSDEVLRAVIK